MDSIVTAARMSFTESDSPELILTLKSSRRTALQGLDELKQILSKGKELTAEIKQLRHKRSLDSNSYLWVLLQELAIVLHTTKDELYLLMLGRYGVFTHVICKPEAVERVKEEWRTVRELGRGKIGSVEGVQLQCFFGSSSYDQKEMCKLVDGVVDECHEVGIDTKTPEEISLMNQEWGKKEGD